MKGYGISSSSKETRPANGFKSKQLGSSFPYPTTRSAVMEERNELSQKRMGTGGGIIFLKAVSNEQD